jgi:hypothetical protein
VDKRGVVTNLSGHLVLVDSARTGLGPGSCVLTPLALATVPDAWRPQVARPYPSAYGAARYAGRAAELSESPEDTPPWDAA